MNSWVLALVGGVVIGVAVTVMLLFNGRVVGISGIVGGLLTKAGGNSWRVSLLLGLIVGGLILRFFSPEVLVNELPVGLSVFVWAGLLVGYGTAMGGGCTSGHGVCGISRLSKRSVVATVVFMVAGILTVAVLRQAGVLV